MTKYILAVDDEPLNLEILQKYLSDEFEILCVTNGEDCLDSITHKMPHILLLDVGLPGISGLDVCRELRRTVGTKKLPIILLSGHALSGHVKEGLDAGANHYLTKPFDLGRLKNLIVELV